MKHIFAKISLIALFCVATCTPAIKKVIVFDLNNVLIKVNRGTIGFKAMLKTGFFNSLVHLQEMREAKEPLYSVLNQVGNKHENPPCDDVGVELPAGLSESQAGTMPYHEVIKQAHAVIDRELARGTLFKSKFQADFIRNIIEITFTPKLVLESIEPVKEGVAFLRDVAQDSEVAVMILSNFEAEAFSLVTKKNSLKPIFTTIPSGNWIVSGMFQDYHYTKPHPFLFEYLTTLCQSRWAVEPHNIIFLDDQIENVTAARNAGIDAYQIDAHHLKESFKATRCAICKKHAVKKQRR